MLSLSSQDRGETRLSDIFVLLGSASCSKICKITVHSSHDCIQMFRLIPGLEIISTNTLPIENGHCSSIKFSSEIWNRSDAALREAKSLNVFKRGLLKAVL